MLASTTFDIPAHEVVEHRGLVRGIIVRSRSVIGNFGASIQSIFGGNISLYTSLCERTREDAFKQIMTNLTKIETALGKATEFGKIGQNYAAWEQLAELRARLTATS